MRSATPISLSAHQGTGGISGQAIHLDASAPRPAAKRGAMLLPLAANDGQVAGCGPTVEQGVVPTRQQTAGVLRALVKTATTLPFLTTAAQDPGLHLIGTLFPARRAGRSPTGNRAFTLDVALPWRSRALLEGCLLCSAATVKSFRPAAAERCPASSKWCRAARCRGVANSSGLPSQPRRAHR